MYKYFTLAEFFRTSTGIDNYPYSIEIRNNIRRLIEFMDILREEWTVYCENNNLGTGAIIVTSGYRNFEVNRKVKGSAKSAHLNGNAVDFKPANGFMIQFQEFVLDYLNGKDYDQIILEDIVNGKASWLHLGLFSNDGKQRKQNLFLTKI